MATAKKTAKTSKKTETAADLDVARKIWLAVNANEAFDQLVAKGEEVEDKVRDNFAKSPSGKRAVTMFEDATSKAKSFREERRADLGRRR